MAAAVAATQAPSTMKLRIFCLSGWGKLPDGIYFPELITLLESRGHRVIKATKPCSNGDITTHVNNLSSLVEENGGLGADCAFIGQSIGSQIILRFLASRPADAVATPVACWVAMGGWVSLARPMKGTGTWCDFSTVDVERLRSICPRILALISTDDPIVGLGGDAYVASWNSSLPWATLRVAEDRGHYIVESLLEDENSAILAALEGST